MKIKSFIKSLRIREKIWHEMVDLPKWEKNYETTVKVVIRHKKYLGLALGWYLRANLGWRLRPFDITFHNELKEKPEEFEWAYLPE